MENENKKNTENAPEVSEALKMALQDMDKDVDLNTTPQPEDDLDEGELARLDNSDEKSFDAVENEELLKSTNDKP